jgi:hypothetical protein
LLHFILPLISLCFLLLLPLRPLLPLKGGDEETALAIASMLAKRLREEAHCLTALVKAVGDELSDKEKQKKKEAAACAAPKCANCYSIEKCSYIGLLTGLTLSKCERCRLVSYCSAACQQQHWTSGFHKQFCVTPEERSVKAAAAAAAEAAAALALSEKEKDVAAYLSVVGGGNNDNNHDLCPVCMGPFGQNIVDQEGAAAFVDTTTTTTTLPCSHVIHTQCMKDLQSFGEKSVCPTCRAELPLLFSHSPSPLPSVVAPFEEGDPKPLSLGECACCGATKRVNNKPLLPCSRCKSVAYCRRECQEGHWKQGEHKKKCTELKAKHEA